MANPPDSNAAGTASSDPNAVARYNARLYALAQAFGGATAPVVISLAGLVGAALLATDKSLATAPVTGFNIGVALGAIPAAMLTKALGRKLGFISGASFGIVGFFVAAAAIMIANFWLFAAGVLLVGIAGGFGQQFRFAAADYATPDYQPKAISLVLVGGIAAAVIGPQLVIATSDLVNGVEYAGAFFAAPILLLVGIIFLAMLKTPKIVIKPADQVSHDEGRPLRVIARQPKFIVAVLCATSTYSLMSFVMTGAPLAMMHHGHHQHDAVLGIQWHVLAMFGPSLFTGHLMARFGKTAIIAAGLIILIASGVFALLGLSLWNFWVSLILLGVGWNFGFLGSTALLTETYDPSEKNKVQGLNDFILFGMVALASLLAGIVLNKYGWETINALIFPVIIIAFVSLIWLLVLEKRAGSAAVKP